MQITQFSDYSLRVLIYLGHLPREQLATVGQMSENFNISQNHLIKVVHNLAKLKIITTVKGKNGGMSLAIPPEKINIGDTLLKTEPHMNLLECFDSTTNTCPIIGYCDLEKIIKQASKQFINELRKYTLADLLNSKNKKEKLKKLNLLNVE